MKLKKVKSMFVNESKKTPLYTVQDCFIHLGSNEKTANQKYHKIINKLKKLNLKYTDIHFFLETYDDDVSLASGSEYNVSGPWYAVETLSMESENEKSVISALTELLEYVKNTLKVKFANAEIIRRNKFYYI